MQVWNVLHTARWKCRTQKIAKNLPPGHHCTTLSVISLQRRHYWQSEENVLNSNISPSCPYNMVNFGQLVVEISSLVWGTPANFNGFRVLASLLHGTLIVGVSQTLRHGGRPSRSALAHILVGIILCHSLFVYVCFCVRFSFFSTVPRDWLGKTSPKWPILCQVGRKTLTQTALLLSGQVLLKHWDVHWDLLSVFWCCWKVQNLSEAAVTQQFLNKTLECLACFTCFLQVRLDSEISACK